MSTDAGILLRLTPPLAGRFPDEPATRTTFQVPARSYTGVIYYEVDPPILRGTRDLVIHPRAHSSSRRIAEMNRVFASESGRDDSRIEFS